MSDDTAAAGVTFVELLEHLDDLADLAASEGYLNFALLLRGSFANAGANSTHYAEREDPPVPLETDPLRRST